MKCATFEDGQALSVEVELKPDFSLSSRESACVSPTADGVRLLQECVSAEELIGGRSRVILSTGMIEMKLDEASKPEWRSLDPITIASIETLMKPALELEPASICRKEEENLSLVRVEIQKCVHSKYGSRGYDLAKHITTRVRGMLPENVSDPVLNQRVVDMSKTEKPDQQPTYKKCEPANKAENFEEVWRLCWRNQFDSQPPASKSFGAPQKSSRVRSSGNDDKGGHLFRRKVESENVRTVRHDLRTSLPAPEPKTPLNPIRPNIEAPDGPLSSPFDPTGLHQTESDRNRQKLHHTQDRDLATRDPDNRRTDTFSGVADEASDAVPTAEDLAIHEERTSAAGDILRYHANIAASANIDHTRVVSSNTACITARERLAQEEIALLRTKKRKRKAEEKEDLVDAGAGRTTGGQREK